MTTAASEVASLTIYQKVRFDDEFDRKTTRFRISAKTLRSISGRAVLNDAFVADWINELAKLGYVGFAAGEYYGVVEARVVEGWVRIGMARIAEEASAIAGGDSRALKKVQKMVEEENLPTAMPQRRIRKTDK